MKIKNFKELAMTESRRKVLEIAEAGLQAIDTGTVIKNNIRFEKGIIYVKDESFSVEPGSRLLVVGVGKCSLEVGAALEAILGKAISGGIVIDVHPGKLKRIKAYAGTHPFPSEQNVDATRKVIQLLAGLTKKDLVIFIISGGGSTLLCQPTNFTYQDEAEIIKCLFAGGATIEEINTMRKHLSLARGGYLAKYAYPAKVISLIFSDVPGDRIEFVASGPTVKDSTTVVHAKKIVRKYEIEKKFGFIANGLIETPKDNKYFENVKNILLVTNKIALTAMAKRGKELGFKTRIKTRELRGEAREVGEKIVRDIDSAPSKTILLYGGETTVTLKEKGRGGRNQELTLSALRFLKNGEIIAAVASDGRDNSDFAGVICDIMTRERAENLGLVLERYLYENRSYEFWNRTQDYILTGDTGSNVSDLIVALKE